MKSKEEQQAYMKAYRQKNRSKCNEHSKAWRLKNKDKFNINIKKWKAKNKDKLRKNALTYYYENRDSCNKRTKVYYQKNKDKVLKNARTYKLKKNWGLTLEEYEQMLIKQNFSCAICGIHVFELSKKLAVDHDHKTGKIRSLLCYKCNVALGHFNDDIELLKKAYEYLKYHKKLLI